MTSRGPERLLHFLRVSIFSAVILSSNGHLRTQRKELIYQTSPLNATTVTHSRPQWCTAQREEAGDPIFACTKLDAALRPLIATWVSPCGRVIEVYVVALTPSSYSQHVVSTYLPRRTIIWPRSSTCLPSAIAGPSATHRLLPAFIRARGCALLGSTFLRVGR